MATAALAIALDHAQTRVKQKPVSVMCEEGDWQPALFSNAAIEPVTGMAILRPRCWETTWFTSNTSPYDKLGKTGYSGITSAAWAEDDPTGVGGGKYLTAITNAAIGEIPLTVAALDMNQGVALSWYCYGDGSDFISLECGWGNTAGVSSGTDEVSFRFYASGKVEVYLSGTFKMEGSISGSGTGANMANSRVDVMILPCRFREIVVVSNQGNGFTYIRDDIPDTDPGTAGAWPVITPNTKFWWKVPSPGFPKVQCAPLKFATSGYVVSTKTAFKRPPPSGATRSTYSLTFAHLPYVSDATQSGTVSSAPVTDALGTFTPDGSAAECRIKISMTGNGKATPSVYGAMVQYTGTNANTPAVNTDVTSYCTEASISVPDNPSDVALDLTLKSPAAIEALGATGLRTQANRPVSAKFGTVWLLNGRMEAPEWDEAIADNLRRYTFSLRDTFKAMERIIFDDPIPLDGQTVTKALQMCLAYAGMTSARWDIEDPGITIPVVPGDGYGLMIQAGDTVAEWVRRLCETYCATWIYGIKPYSDVTKFYLKAPATLGTTPKATLYATQAQAVAAGASARFGVFQGFHEAILEPEANELYVTGIDPRTGRPIVKAVRDAASMDPATVVGSRPSNWVGEVLTVGYYDPALMDDAAVSAAATLMQTRLFRVRRVVEWQSEMLFEAATDLPLWRGDVVRLVFSDASYKDYRITAFSATLKSEHNVGTSKHTRPARYTGEEL